MAACGNASTTSPAAQSSGARSTSPAAGGPIEVLLLDFALALEAEVATAGEVTFAVRNAGEVPHELVVTSTDLDAAELPVDALLVDEGAVEVVARSSLLDIGGTEELTVDLPAGHYVLICNLPGHYDPAQDVGMHANFEVR